MLVEEDGGGESRGTELKQGGVQALPLVGVSSLISTFLVSTFSSMATLATDGGTDTKHIQKHHRLKNSLQRPSVPSRNEVQCFPSYHEMKFSSLTFWIKPCVVLSSQA